MPQLREKIAAHLEHLEQSYPLTLYHLSQIEESIGIVTFRNGFFQELTSQDFGNADSLEKEILNMERRAEFTASKTPSSQFLQLQILGDILSVRRMNAVAETSVLELSVDGLENELVKYITGDEQVTGTYERLGIKPLREQKSQAVLHDDILTLFGLLENRGIELNLEYVRDVIKRKLPDVFDQATGSVHASLDGWYDFYNRRTESLAEKIGGMISMCTFDDVRRCVNDYTEGVRKIAQKIRKIQPAHLGTITCDQSPLAIRFSSRGELVVFDWDQMIRWYDLKNGEKVGEAKTRLKSGVRGTALGPDSFYGGLFVDDDGSVFAYTFGDLQKIGRYDGHPAKEQNNTLPIPYTGDMIQVAGSEESGDNIVGMAKTGSRYYVLMFDRDDSFKIEVYDNQGHKTLTAPLHERFTVVNTGEDISPRIQSYGNELFLAAGRKMYVINSDLGKVSEVKFDGINQAGFAATKFDFDSEGILWIINMHQVENFPSVKAYQLTKTNDGYTTQFETFVPFREIEPLGGMRDIAIDIKNGLLAVSDFARNIVEVYSVNEAH